VSKMQFAGESVLTWTLLKMWCCWNDFGYENDG